MTYIYNALCLLRCRVIEKAEFRRQTTKQYPSSTQTQLSNPDLLRKSYYIYTLHSNKLFCYLLSLYFGWFQAFACISHASLGLLASPPSEIQTPKGKKNV